MQLGSLTRSELSGRQDVGIEGQFKHGGALLSYKIVGHFDGTELVRMTRGLWNQGIAQPQLKCFLGDLTQVDSIGVTPEQLREIAELGLRAAEEAGGYRVALVSHHEVVSAVGHMYRVYMDSEFCETRVFKDKLLAIAWLSEVLPDSTLEVHEVIAD
ncbi:hypothetical protein [Aurantivibrio plasticivorans]